MTATPATPAADAYDPYAAAMAAQSKASDKTYFGEVTIVDVWACVLEKGVGKRAFNPGQDDPDRRCTAIKITVTPLRGQYDIEVDTIDWAKDWTKHTLPSLRDAGVSLRDLQGQFVQVKRVPTGETYTNKAGEDKEKTAVVFVTVYPDRQACQDAADAFYGKRDADGAEPLRANPATPRVLTPDPAAQQTPPRAAQQQPATPPENSAERQFAAQSLPLIWQATGQDKVKFLDMLKANPMLSKYFNAGSDEVCALTGEIPF